MSITGTSNTPNVLDPWGQSFQEPSQGVSVAHKRIPVRSQPIPDDWDDGDEEGNDDDEDNEKIWENANTKSPMPELIISRPSTGPTVVSPPVTAIQSPMRILKRPSSTSNSTSASSPLANATASSKSFAEREATYQKARERIFGEGQGGESSATEEKAAPDTKTSIRPSSQSAASTFRNPRGLGDPPDPTSQTTTPRGFTAKRGLRNSKPGDESQQDDTGSSVK